MGQLARYIVNGLSATAVHYLVLTFNLEVANFPSAGLANLVAAAAGITTSFIGSRYFVFRQLNQPINTQAMKFIGLYGAIALLHSLILLLWTDWLKFDYKAGFIVAIAVQIFVSYYGNKFLVFKS